MISFFHILDVRARASLLLSFGSAATTFLDHVCPVMIVLVRQSILRERAKSSGGI